jgi:hypothetical protein
MQDGVTSHLMSSPVVRLVGARCEFVIKSVANRQIGFVVSANRSEAAKSKTSLCQSRALLKSGMARAAAARDLSSPPGSVLFGIIDGNYRTLRDKNRSDGEPICRTQLSVQISSQIRIACFFKYLVEDCGCPTHNVSIFPAWPHSPCTRVSSAVPPLTRLDTAKDWLMILLL